MPHETSESLKSRSYVGLLLSQFLAAFNDQALHFVAIFYAGDMLVRFVELKHIKEETIVTLVPLCFIAPFFVFSPLAGLLADKYSKRATIVFWKYAEIGITGLALLGFLAPHMGWASQETLAVVGALLVVASVFMMGAHSTFFIPAKYGIMPEILSTSVLSRGNGLLEGTSFTANILGTAFGGFCYAAFKSKIQDTPLPGGAYDHHLVLGNEWIIGAVLMGLAVVGTLAARLIARVPAAAPDQPLVWQPWIPLKSSFAVLKTSRPLVLATVGIAFFLFMTFFLRQTLIFQGESAKDYHHYLSVHKRQRLIHDKAAERAAARAQQRASDESASNDDDAEGAQTSANRDSSASADDFLNPAEVIPDSSAAQRDELRIAMLAALLGLGVGIGCASAGMLSGDRIELGLVPVGAVMMMLLTAALAWAIPAGSGQSEWPTRILLVLVGVAAGLYIVPLYTLLQHRAPKESKGSLVAMSNFFNVSGGLVAIGVFSLLTAAFKSMFHLNLTPEDARRSPDVMAEFVRQLHDQLDIPRLLFLAGSLITLLMLLLLCWTRPDFLLRTLSWFRVPGRRRLHAVGLSNVPANGHIILATNCHGMDQWLQVLSAIDRGSRFIRRRDAEAAHDGEDQLLESVARRLKILIVAPNSSSAHDWPTVVESGANSLEAGNLVGLTLDCPTDRPQADALLVELQGRVPSEILPVYCGAAAGHAMLHRSAWRPIVVVGKPLPFGTTPDQIRAAIHALGDGAIGHGAGSGHA